MISIIIPVYNEEKILSEKENYFKELGKVAELIVVNGQSSDRSKEQAEKFAKVLSSRKGRAFQMNVGAAEATGDILLFLPVYVTISPQAFLPIKQAIEEKFIGGCLTKSIENANPIDQFLVFLGNFRARKKQIFFLDQGIFVRKDGFDHIGGFPQVPTFEDVLFSDVLKEQGKVKVLSFPVVSLADRGKRKFLRKVLLNIRILLTFKKKDLHKLASRYMNIR